MLGKPAMQYDTKPYTPDITKQAWHMSDKVLRKNICEEDPAHCRECMLCEFGKEYLVREALKKEAM